VPLAAVHCCGYDSIPSDMGTLLMADHCKRKLGKKLAKVREAQGSYAIKCTRSSSWPQFMAFTGSCFKSWLTPGASSA
jgi:hypothetical protein